MVALANDKPKTSAAEVFYELYLLNDDSGQFTEREKQLMGLGYLFLNNDDLDFLGVLVRELKSELASEILQILYKVMDRGLQRLDEMSKPVSDEKRGRYLNILLKVKLLNRRDG